jgi:predicted  nucleic acid-binding Zn-ribbon protein
LKSGLGDSNRKIKTLETELDGCRTNSEALKRQLEERNAELAALRKQLNEASAPDTATLLNEKDDEITRKVNLIEELKAIHAKDLA